MIRNVKAILKEHIRRIEHLGLRRAFQVAVQSEIGAQSDSDRSRQSELWPAAALSALGGCSRRQPCMAHAYVRPLAARRRRPTAVTKGGGCENGPKST
jgi:hypothetical protein